jgi:hypothetical protein
MDTRNNPIIIDGRNGNRSSFGAVPQTRTTSALLSQVLVIASLGFFT